MDSVQEVKLLKEATKAFPPLTQWNEITEDDIYLVPPIRSIKRKFIRVVYKDNTHLRYIDMSDKDMALREMFKTSLASKFIVKPRKF